MHQEKELCIAQSLTEAKMLTELLKNNGIYAYYVNPSASQFNEHRGGSVNQPQIIYVDEADFDAAKALVPSSKLTFDDDLERDYRQVLQHRRLRARITLIFLAVLMAGMLAAVLYFKLRS